MFLLSNSNRRTDIFDVLEHENGILFGVLQLLEKKKGFLVIAQTPLDSVAWRKL
jgi:hypothetical protein